MPDLDPDDLIQNFLDQSLDQVAEIGDALMALDRSQARPTPQQAGDLARSLDSLAERAGLMDFAGIHDLSLAMEQALPPLARSETTPAAVAQAVNILLDSLNILEDLVRKADDGSARDTSAILEALRGLAPARPAAPKSPAAKPRLGRKPGPRPCVPASEEAALPSPQAGPACPAPAGLLEPTLRLDQDTNPMGIPALALNAALARAPQIHHYPQNGSPDLVAALARHLRQPENRILVGNGLNELIDLILRVKARPGQDHVLTGAACPPRFQIIADLCRVELRRTPREPDFSLPLEALVQAAGPNTAAVLLSNPDEATGHAATTEELTVMTALMPETTLVIVDETLIDFAWPDEEYSILPLLDRFPNLVVIRSFCRGFGLAGLRLGYGLMHESLADVLRRVRLPFSVNSLAESAGLAVLADTDHAMESLSMAITERDRLAKGLTALGCDPVPGQGNFVFFIPPRPAQDVAEGLAKKGVLVRTMNGYGFPQALRVSVGLPEQNGVFLEAMEAVFKDL